MEEMMKTMENQSENTESQDDNENFPQTSQESQSDSEIVESLQTQNKENVNQSEEELSEEEIETQYDKTTGNKSDSEDSDNLEDWFDEKESESETEQKEAIETLPKEDILGILLCVFCGISLHVAQRFFFLFAFLYSLQSKWYIYIQCIQISFVSWKKEKMHTRPRFKVKSDCGSIHT